MLGIGMQEILIILVVALIVIGPKRLPDLARTLGKGFAEFRKAADDLQETVRMDLQKEKHEVFRQRYPDMVPDEDKEEETTLQPDSNGADEAATPTEIVNTPTEPELSPQPPPEPSYVLEEIEGGDETEDDTKDG
ncbi:MAG: Sec-independent protein translocase protein TatB [bacterium]|nr:Sec-independent protein translocase protein TatB [bacterium]MDT8365806.1 Sec-independent protein translocase protein TatB [bacterium]